MQETYPFVYWDEETGEERLAFLPLMLVPAATLSISPDGKPLWVVDTILLAQQDPAVYRAYKLAVQEGLFDHTLVPEAFPSC
jgi:hypothetical protein